jgi:hypothetical protein
MWPARQFGQFRADHRSLRQKHDFGGYLTILSALIASAISTSHSYILVEAIGKCHFPILGQLLLQSMMSQNEQGTPPFRATGFVASSSPSLAEPNRWAIAWRDRIG